MKETQSVSFIMATINNVNTFFQKPAEFGFTTQSGVIDTPHAITARPHIGESHLYRDFKRFLVCNRARLSATMTGLTVLLMLLKRGGRFHASLRATACVAAIGTYMSARAAVSNDRVLIANKDKDDGIRALIRLAMLRKDQNILAENGVDTAMYNAIEQNNYLLGNIEMIRSANTGVVKTEALWDAYFRRLGVNPRTGKCETQPVQVIPPFAAACAVYIHSKLGKLSTNPANILLVERKYYEICRKRKVHELDARAHIQYVMNAVFNEDVLDAVATTRRRLPKWLTWGLSVSKPKSGEREVC
jgi:hypothetical protein